ALRKLTGRSIVHTPDAGRAVQILDGRVERSGPGSDRLLVADPDTAALNAALVAAGVRVTGITAERRTLEDVVLSVTGSGADRFGVQHAEPGRGAPGPASCDIVEQRPAHDPSRAGETGPAAAQLGQHRAAVRAAGAGGRVRRGHPPGPATWPGPGPAVRGAVQRVAVPGGGAGHRAADLPAGGGRGSGRRLDRGRGGLRDPPLPAGPPRRPGPAGWPPAGPARAAGPGCCPPSWSRSSCTRWPRWCWSR